MVRVCDAIMGSGKTSATISYINAHPEKKFLYVTPYLPEATRIKDGCPDAMFVEPSDRLPQYGFSKSQHSMALIHEGRNIASTHAALSYYTPDTFRELQEQGYTVIIDEEVTIMQKTTFSVDGDIRMAMEAGCVTTDEHGMYVLTEKASQFMDSSCGHMFRMMASHSLLHICQTGADSTVAWYWVFPPTLFREVENIIVLTYLFEHSEMNAYLDMIGAPYKYIGISRTPDGGYTFSEEPDYVPEYVQHLGDMIHLEDRPQLNDVGKHKNALSMNWYKSHPDEMGKLRRNISNFFRNRTPGGSSDRMCGHYGKMWGAIRGAGYWNSDVVFTQKSSNAFRNRSVLVYPVNVFPNVNIVNYYQDHGVYIDPDRYALSIMVQWIWRSAIRDGKEIYLYVPSRRMRELLVDWINSVSGGEACD